MHKHGAAIQDSKPFESPQLLPRLLINAFAGVQNERTAQGGGGAHLANVATESQRMTPAIILDHTYREIVPSQLRPKRIVVADCSYSAEKISYASPP
jgi:hypothetical protein